MAVYRRCDGSYYCRSLDDGPESEGDREVALSRDEAGCRELVDQLNRCPEDQAEQACDFAGDDSWYFAGCPEKALERAAEITGFPTSSLAPAATVKERLGSAYRSLGIDLDQMG